MNPTRKLRLSVSVAALFCATGALAQDIPRGAAATGCNLDTYARITSERTGETLYWNNPNCPAGSGGTDVMAPAEAPPLPGPAPTPPAVDEQDDEEEENAEEQEPYVL